MKGAKQLYRGNLPDRSECGIRVKRVDVHCGIMEIMVQLNCPDRYSSLEVCKKITKLRPSIVNHNCYNDGAEKFGQCMLGTSLVHLYEHLIIDIMLYQSPGEEFSGISRWLDEWHGTGLIRINFYHDTQTLLAISKAAKVFNSVMCIQK